MSWWIITFDRIFNLTIFRWQFALEVVNSTKSKEIWSIAHSCSWKTGKWSWELYPIRADQGQGLKINCYFSIDPKLGLLLCFFPSIVVSRVFSCFILFSIFTHFSEWAYIIYLFSNLSKRSVFSIYVHYYITTPCPTHCP